MNLNDFGFKFQIGDNVRSATYKAPKEEKPYFDRPADIRGVVVERMLIEYSGGMLRNYAVLWGSAAGHTDSTSKWVHEVGLAADDS